MKVYGTSHRLCAIARYSELETCVLLLSATDAVLQPDYGKRKTFAGTIARIFVTKGDLRIHMDEGRTDGLAAQGETALGVAPDAIRLRVEGLLAFFVPTDVGLDQASVSVSVSPIPLR